MATVGTSGAMDLGGKKKREKVSGAKAPMKPRGVGFVNDSSGAANKYVPTTPQVSPIKSVNPQADALQWRPPSTSVTGSPSVPGTSSNMPTNGTNPYNGYASQYSPGALQESIWRDPQLVLNNMFTDQGISTASPMYSTMRDFYGADPQSLWMLLSGNKQGAFGDAGDYTNFLNSLYGNYMTPGGRAVDFNEILGILGGVGDQSGMAVQDQSPLWQLLSSGGAAEQVRSMYGLLADAARVGLSPAMAGAFMDAMARQSDSYLSQTATGSTTDPYYQWWQNPMRGR